MFDLESTILVGKTKALLSLVVTGCLMKGVNYDIYKAKASHMLFVYVHFLKKKKHFIVNFNVHQSVSM